MNESGGPWLGVSADSAAPLDGERKPVTVLFADVVGFIALAETLDPEPLRDLINSLFGCLVPCVERFGGSVDKFVGDELMALFGAPVMHEDDAERAVRAALAMRAAVAKFNLGRGIGLSIHIGVNTGRVVAGEVGAGGWRQYSVIGDAVNVAARLTQIAGPGEIVVGPETKRHTEHLFQMEELGQVLIKGRASPVTGFRVAGERAGSGGRRHAPEGRMASPMVGRTTESATLRQAVHRLVSGRGAFVAVTGDAGIGKSCLIAEVSRTARRRGRAPEDHFRGLRVFPTGGGFAADRRLGQRPTGTCRRRPQDRSRPGGIVGMQLGKEES